MVFPIAGGNESKGFDVENSLRFNDNDSPLLSRTPGTTATDRKKATISFWFKIGNITDSFRSLYRFNDGSGTGAVYLRSGNDLQFAWEASSSNIDVRPDGVFRDPSAWYHAFIKFDTTQSTAADRVEIYINGVERTYSTANYPNQNDTVNHLTSDKTYYIGGDGQSSDKYFDGYIAEFNVVDGQAKSHLDFGEFNDNGVWIPKKYTGTYGNNGFHLEFKQTGTSANSSGIGADTSGNDKHFTVTNLAANDVTTDTCTNNFATLNPLNFADGGYTMSEGNVKINTNDATRCAGPSTIGVSSGKWYWEIKHTSGASNSQIGIAAEPDELTRTKTSVGESSTSWSYVAPTGKIRNTSNDLHSGSTLADGDIMNIALDLDNNYIYFGKNNTYQNSGDPTSGSSGTGGFAVTAGLTYFYLGGDRTTGGGATQEVNFGNPSFSISSGNTDGKYGNFEYAPPSGYYALCTKRLAEFG